MLASQPSHVSEHQVQREALHQRTKQNLKGRHPTPSSGLHCVHQHMPAHCPSRPQSSSITQMHTEWKGQQESLALRNLTLPLPGARTEIWKHPQKWALLNTGNRQQDVEKSSIPTKESAELEEADCRTQRTCRHERNPARHTSFHDLTELES